MLSPRRIGLNTSATRAALIEAATQVIQQEGYAALTSRRAADKAGLKPQLVHYYFRTMDDLVAAIVRDSGDEVVRRMARAAASHEPLRALWKLATDLKAVLFTMQVVAMANQHETVRAETVRYAEQFRIAAAEIVAPCLKRGGAGRTLPAVAVTLMMTAIGGLLAREKILGMSVGHREMEALIEAWLSDLATTGSSDASPKREKASPFRKPRRVASRPSAR